MIEKKGKINISGGVAPYNVTIHTTCTNATVSPEVSDINGTELEYTLTFENEDVLNSCIGAFTVVVTDALGASSTEVLSLTNPCNLALRGGVSQSGLGFYVSPINGTPPYTYQWIFDSNLFSSGDTNDQQLDLTYKGTGSVPYEVEVLVTDAKGCTVSGSKSGTIATFDAVPELTAVYSDTTSLYCPIIQLETVGTPIPDWTTLDIADFYNISTGVKGSITSTDLGNGRVQITLGTVAQGKYEATWTVTATNRQVAVGVIVLDVPNLAGASPNFVVLDPTYLLIDGATTIPILMEDLIMSDVEIDWSTFNIITAPAVGDATYTWAGSTRTLTYNVPTTPTGVDIIEWDVDDVDGNSSGTHYITFNLNAISAPVAVNNAESVDFNSTNSFDVTSNDTGDVNPNSIVITQAPTLGTASVEDGAITYVAPLSIGTDTIKYKVNNNRATGYSSEATVTVTVGCGSGWATLADASESCTQTISIQNAQWTVNPDNLQITLDYDSYVSDTCGDPTVDHVSELVPKSGTGEGGGLAILSGYGYKYTGLTTNGYVESIRLYVHNGTTIEGYFDLDLSSYVYTGTIEAQYDAFLVTLKNNIITDINAYDVPGLGANGIHGTNYFLTVTGDFATGLIEIIFADNLVNNRYWIGVNRNDYAGTIDYDGANPGTVMVKTTTNHEHSTEAIVDMTCGRLVKERTWQGIVDPNEYNFYNLQVTGPTGYTETADATLLTSGETTNYADTCTVHTLSVSTTSNCPNNTYTWEVDTGGGYTGLPDTTYSIAVATAGTYRVTTTCEANGCTEIDTIVVA